MDQRDPVPDQSMAVRVVPMPLRLGSRADHLVQPAIGVAYGRLDGAEQVTALRVLVEGGHCGDGDRAGHLAVRVPAHTVRDGEQAAASVRRVLVAFAEEADVGAGGVAECDGHLRNSMTVLPMRIGTPSGTGVGRVTFERSRYVPLVEPRSSTIH